MNTGDNNIDQLVYVGKRFYNIGNGKSVGSITISENSCHLRQELVIATIAERSLNRFYQVKAEKGVFTSSKC